MIRLLLSVFFICNGLLSVAQDTAVIDINRNANFDGFRLLEKDLDQYNAFFTGENHLYHVTNVKLELKLFRFLHENAGVNVFVMEFGAATTYLLNKYITTSDTTYLNALQYYPFNVYSDLFKGLHDYYHELPADQKFFVRGIDREGSDHLSAEALVDLLPDERPHDSIVVHTDALRMVQKRSRQAFYTGPSPYYTGLYDTQSALPTLRSFILNFDRHKAHYRDFLGDDFTTFEGVVESLRIEIKCLDFEKNQSLQSVSLREEHMYQNMLTLFDTMPDAKVFGQFGRCHVSRSEDNNDCGFYGLNSLNQRINISKHPMLSGKVLSIGILYEHAVSRYNADTKYTLLMDTLRSFKPSALTLTRLHKSDSSFGELNEHFDYIVVNRLPEDSLPLLNPYGVNYSNTRSVYDYEYFMFNGSYGTRKLKLASMNDALFGNTEGFEEEQFVWSASFGYLWNFDTYNLVNLTVLDEQTKTLADSSTVSLKGFWISEHIGRDITPNNWFNIMPSMGFGYGQLTVKLDSLASSGPALPLGEFNSQTFRNHSLFLDGRIDVLINTRIVNFGVYSGYQFDFSNSRWQFGGQALESGARTKLHGWYAGVTLGLNIRI